MQKHLQKWGITALCSLLFYSSSSQNPNCSPDVFSIVYQGNAAVLVNESLTTPAGEVMAAGRALKLTIDFESYDGWICKLSPRGSFLWAKRFMPPGYNTGGFHSIVAASDSTYIVTGGFSYARKRATDFVVEVLYSATVILMVDKYGNLIWMKYFNKFLTRGSSVENVFKMQGGDYIASIHVFGNNFSRRILCRMDPQGAVKWSSILYSDSYWLGFSNMKQLSNGDLLFAGTTYSTDFTRSGYGMMAVDAATGNLLWDRGYTIVNTATSYPGSADAVYTISEYADGKIGLHTSFADTGRLVLRPHYLKAATLVADQSGILVRATGYFNTVPGCRMVDALPPDAAGNQVLLMDDGNKGILTKVDPSGQPIMQRSYGLIEGNLAPFKLLPGNRILFTGRTIVAMMGFIKTDISWDISCKETPVNVIAENVLSAFAAVTLEINYEAYDKDLFVPAGGGINRIAYDFTPIIDCELTCCSDTVVRVPKIELCNVPYYSLPNNFRVTESGVYDILYQTPKGCDSTVVYDINLYKTPEVTLGGDLCLEGKDSVVLRATSGYDVYRWMNLETPDSTYTVRQPGRYWVQVSNMCGSGVDTVEVFEKCDYPIYIPTGFTPNNDGLNDVFRIPKENKNKLISLKVYNRWGQVVFETADMARGWDGNSRGNQHPTGVYVYFVVMETLDKRRIARSGTLTLIR